MSQENFHTLTHISPGLTDNNLSQALSKWFNKDLTFTHWEYVGDTGKGDSYLSELIKIKIHGKDQDGGTQHVQVVLKNIPKNLSRRLTYRSDEFFKNEINFYNHVLPRLLEFQASKKPSDPFDNYTKIFHSYTDGVNDCIILEDVTLEHFGPAVRQKGIDVDHCRVTIKTLAKFHAMSYAMKDQQPEEFDKLRSHLFELYYHERLWGWYERFWARVCGIAIDAVEREYPDSVYLKKIKEFAVPDRYKRMCEAVIETEATGVISHGDSWTNNFLYKYEGERKPLDAKMIDFQLSRCGSPVLDVSFFIYACTTKDLRDTSYDELLDYYYSVLSKQISELGSDPQKLYPRDRFAAETKKYSFFGLAFSFEATPFIVLDPEDAVNMDMKGEEKLNIDDVWQMKPFKTKEGRLREADNIVHAVDHGYI